MAFFPNDARRADKRSIKPERSLTYACEESGDLKIPLEKGVLTQERVHFIEDLIEDTKQGHPHEQNETRCFKSVGMGLFDVRTAQLIYEKALEKGIGQKLNF